MKYYVEAYRSVSLCCAYAVMELRYKPMRWGPWKRLSTAKRKAAELRKDRVVTMDDFGSEPIDRGPSFIKVRVIAEQAKEAIGG